MPIAALPQSTAQAIGSISVLSDACSVVKELLDNALDASASSVSVEISQNTVDVIQVKDNGHGIAPEDHGAVCKRAYTSKIQTLDDLRNVGGRSLGFRGEALASAAEMAGSLTVSTRTQSQLVGSLLKYDRRGELVSNERASHPVGTTVRVTDFLKHIPVRRQTALKNAAKTITKTKKLLQAYAIAKPSTRLSLKVLKSKNESNNWIYAPKPNANLVDAALKVVGAEIAAQCIYKEWPSEAHDEGQEVASTSNDANPSYRLVAFLPKADADFSELSNPGQFVSVDGRPLSTSRGTPKEIVRLFKTYIRSAAKARAISASLSDPLFCLHIECPRGSYDVNVEPAKDDVLFADPQIIVSLAESLFKDVYGDLDDDNRNAGEEAAEKTAGKDDFSLLLARKPAVQFPVSPPSSNPAATARQTGLDSSGATSTCVSETAPQSSSDSQPRDVASSSEGEVRPSERNSLNPWTIAKTHFFHRNPNTPSQSRSTPSQLVASSRGRESSERGGSRVERNQRVSPSPPPPSPSHSTSHSSSPETRDSPMFVSARQLSRRKVSVPTLDLSARSARERARERYGNGALDTWFKKTTQVSLNSPSSSSSTVAGQREHNREDRSESEVLHKILGPHDSIQPVSGVHKPFKVTIPRAGARNSALPDLYSSQMADDSRSVEPSERRQEFPVLERWSSLLHQPPSQENGSELENALDFERRKRAAILSRREQMRNSQESNALSNSQLSLNSPHQNRYLAARAALTASANTTTAQPDDSPAESETAPGLDRNDPRAYFMRHQEMDQSNSASGTGLKIKRVHTSRLPLEKIPDGFDTHDLALQWPAPFGPLSASYRRARLVDSYIRSGTGFDAFAAPDLASFSKIWEARLAALIREKYRTKDGDGAPDLQLDLYAAIRSSD
ncbi:hypothetical protein VTN77DRAFT_5086 [Rasamsonia byssochlamydoides]|uniref:uncharacterized protein n=1 Tax=Rasamsonia byssochlamydoides TaxID=89139 RepID=UPI0037432C78